MKNLYGQPNLRRMFHSSSQQKYLDEVSKGHVRTVASTALCICFCVIVQHISHPSCLHVVIQAAVLPLGGCI